MPGGEGRGASPPMAGLAERSGSGRGGTAARLACGRRGDEGIAALLLAGTPAEHAAQAPDQEHGHDGEEDQVEKLEAVAHGSSRCRVLVVPRGKRSALPADIPMR